LNNTLHFIEFISCCSADPPDADPTDIEDSTDTDSLAKHGTASVVIFQNTIGTLPTRNYTEGQFEHAEPISGEKMTETILIQQGYLLKV
jgi:hypothetical protein